MNENSERPINIGLKNVLNTYCYLILVCVLCVFVLLIVLYTAHLEVFVSKGNSVGNSGGRTFSL